MAFANDVRRNIDALFVMFGRIHTLRKRKEVHGRWK
jgi:hypothetical protein